MLERRVSLPRSASRSRPCRRIGSLRRMQKFSEKAALLSGILCRLQGYEKDGKLRALQDCVLFLQAQKLGLVALTANVGDYDILLQLVPAGRALFYRQKMKAATAAAASKQQAQPQPSLP